MKNYCEYFGLKDGRIVCFKKGIGRLGSPTDPFGATFYCVWSATLHAVPTRASEAPGCTERKSSMVSTQLIVDPTACPTVSAANRRL